LGKHAIMTIGGEILLRVMRKNWDQDMCLYTSFL
jgi:hypothetical protein